MARQVVAVEATGPNSSGWSPQHRQVAQAVATIGQHPREPGPMETLIANFSERLYARRCEEAFMVGTCLKGQMVQDDGKADKEMTNETTWGPQLRLPVQAAPVHRTPGAAALRIGSSVEAAQLSDWVKLVDPCAWAPDYCGIVPNPRPII
jgi:hypothetical protein